MAAPSLAATTTVYVPAKARKPAKAGRNDFAAAGIVGCRVGWLFGWLVNRWCGLCDLFSNEARVGLQGGWMGTTVECSAKLMRGLYVM
jgi:hypothetical protein